MALPKIPKPPNIPYRLQPTDAEMTKIKKYQKAINDYCIAHTTERQKKYLFKLTSSYGRRKMTKRKSKTPSHAKRLANATKWCRTYDFPSQSITEHRKK